MSNQEEQRWMDEIEDMGDEAWDFAHELEDPRSVSIYDAAPDDARSLLRSNR